MLVQSISMNNYQSKMLLGKNRNLRNSESESKANQGTSFKASVFEHLRFTPAEDKIIENFKVMYLKMAKNLSSDLGLSFVSDMHREEIAFYRKLTDGRMNTELYKEFTNSVANKYNEYLKRDNTMRSI